MKTEKEEPRISRMAIASLVCGILTMTCIGSPVFFLPALITGHLAWNLIKESKEMLVGRWMAAWGMFCGWGFILLGILAVIYLLAAPYTTVYTETIGEYNGYTIGLQQQKVMGREQYRYRLVKKGNNAQIILIEEYTSEIKKPGASISDNQIYYQSLDGDVLSF